MISGGLSCCSTKSLTTRDTSGIITFDETNCLSRYLEIHSCLSLRQQQDLVRWSQERPSAGFVCLE